MWSKYGCQDVMNGTNMVALVALVAASFLLALEQQKTVVVLVEIDQ